LIGVCPKGLYAHHLADGLVRRGGTCTVIRVNAQYDVEYHPGMTIQDVLDALKFSFRMIVV
jgi:hypothetical protein